MGLGLWGGRVLLPDGTVEQGRVLIEDGIVASVDGRAGRPTSIWNTDGLLILPGIVDLHGDAFERQVMPRPKIRFPLDMALLDTDAQMAANGITTAYHGITFSWEPGLRGRESAIELINAVRGLRDHFACDTRVHLRFETYNLAGGEEVESWIGEGRIDLLAFNDHIPLFRERLSEPERLRATAERGGMSLADFLALLTDVASRRPQVPAAIERLARRAVAAGIPCASHDDETPEMRRWFHDLGCRICEFPVDEATAREGMDAGDWVVLGSPNLIRGASHCGRLLAADAVARGLCSILTSDYYYPALLRAPFRLAEMGLLTFPEAWRLVSANPARAAGLQDRGDIAPGHRADIIVVDDRIPGRPRIAATIVGGEPVHMAGRAFPEGRQRRAA